MTTTAVTLIRPPNQRCENDTMGRAHKTSNPFRPWQSETAIWTTTTFDPLGRVLTVTTPDKVEPNFYDVKEFYATFLKKDGWIVVNEDAGRANSEITFKKGQFSISVFNSSTER